MTPGNIKAALAYCDSQEINGGTDFNEIFTTAFRVPNVQAIYFLSDGEVYDHNDQLLNKIKRLSNATSSIGGKQIFCHTTAFFAEESGQKLMKSIATATGGTYLNFNSSSSSTSN